MKGYIKFALVFTLAEAILTVVALMGYMAYSITRVIRARCASVAI